MPVYSRPEATVVRGRTLALCAVTLCLAGMAARAEDSLLYVGASAGQSNVKVGQIDFNNHDLGWKVTVGTRPVSLLGAEVSYVDLGKPSVSIQGVDNVASAKGVSAFGLVYAPLPLPLIDAYAKLGLARLQATANSSIANCGTTGPGCSNFSFDRKNTQTAYGIGLQAHFGPLAGRLEYEHFQTAGGTPSLLSAGLYYSFL